MQQCSRSWASCPRAVPSSGLRARAALPVVAQLRTKARIAPQTRCCSGPANSIVSTGTKWGHPDAQRRRQEAMQRRAARQQELEELRSASNAWWRVQQGQNMLTVNTREEYASALQHCKERSPLVVVDFFAPWCSGCRTLYPKLRQIASANLDVAFIKVNTEVDEMRVLADELGVTGLPFFNIHSSCGNHVAAFTANLMKVNRLRAEIAALKQSCATGLDGLSEELAPSAPGVLQRV